MLTAHHLTKSYGILTILDDATFSVSVGEHVGLIGPNGSGKTTLLRICAGLERPDTGQITLHPGDLRRGYLPQGLAVAPETTVGEVLAGVGGDARVLAEELAALALRLVDSPDQIALQADYDRALARLARHDEGRVAALLDRLGLGHIDGDAPVDRLSGGQKTRLSLALVLLDDPDLLLLDEPTNHLDIAMLEWLEAWLRGFPGAALVVSHDRAFLDATVTRILDLDPDTHAVRSYVGNYGAYVEQVTAERARQWAAWRDQEAEVRRLRQDIARTMEQSRSVERSTTPRQPGVRRIAKKVARKAKSREKKLERYLEDEERVEKPWSHWQMKLDLDAGDHVGQDVLQLETLSIGYDQPLLAELNLHIMAGQRVVLAGSNGVGKTTLLRTIAGEIPPLAGDVRLGHSVRPGYLAQEQELLDPAATPLESIQRMAAMNETDARAFLHYYLFAGDDALRRVDQLSYGERARLMLAGLVAAGANFLLLDEPINHLDIPSRERFEQALEGYAGTVLVVVHDRYFIERMATHIWWVDDDGIRPEVRVAAG